MSIYPRRSTKTCSEYNEDTGRGYYFNTTRPHIFLSQRTTKRSAKLRVVNQNNVHIMLEQLSGKIIYLIFNQFKTKSGSS